MSSIVDADVHHGYARHVTHRDISHIYDSYISHIIISFKVHKFYQRNAYCNKYHSVYLDVYICWYDLFIYRVIRLLVDRIYDLVDGRDFELFESRDDAEARRCRLIYSWLPEISV